jgi:hypothetical protein
MIRCNNNTLHLKWTSTDVRLNKNERKKIKERKKEKKENKRKEIKEMLREFLFHLFFMFANSRLQATFGNSLLIRGGIE